MFGSEKFVKRMTLNEALCDDLVALEACVCRPLPRLDTSGRQLLLMEPCRHTREGYTSESMVSVVWSIVVQDVSVCFFVSKHLTQLHSLYAAPRYMVCNRVTSANKHRYSKWGSSNCLVQKLYDLGF